jgi:structural maintenance of chromosomes protein 6
MRDAGFKHLEYTELDDQRATQQLKNRPDIIGENHAAENGIIESVTCVNFMCHERLHVTLGPLINFIVGENGSGKSAVLTGITLCLGAKASSTNRGGSLKSFIKEGRDQATLIVKLKNQGNDAYQSDIFGESIIIERAFTRSGTSRFKVKSATGRIISAKRADVDQIVQYYAMQVDNPLNILSQDNARQFLNSSSASEKYKHFVMGVQLEQLDNDYKLIAESTSNNEEKLQVLAEITERAKKQFEEANRLRETVEKNKEFRLKSRLYVNQMAWAQVEEQEKLLRKRIEDIADVEARIVGAEEAVLAKSRILDEVQERLARAHDVVQSVAEEAGQHQEQIDNARDNYEEAKRALTTLHREERDVHQRLTVAKQQVTACLAKIKAEEDRLGEHAGSARDEKEAALKDAKEAEASLSEKKATETMAIPTMNRRREEVQQEIETLGVSMEKKRKEIEDVERQIASLQQRRGAAVDSVHPKVRSLLKLIEKDSTFTQKPIGPLGQYIQLLEPKWSAVIEKSLGQSLDGFVVVNKRDQQHLSNLMQRQEITRSPIFIGNARPLNISGKEPDQSLKTILRVLKFDNDLVRDQLIINFNIEQVILIEKRPMAEQIMLDEGGTPPNVSACICFHDSKRGHGLRLTNRGGTISTSPVAPSNLPPRMKSDADSQIAIQKENMSYLEGELRGFQCEQRALQQKHQRYVSDLAAQKRMLDGLEKEIRLALTKIENISEELDAFEGVDDRLNSLREALSKAQAEENHHGGQYGNMRIQRPELNNRAEACKAVLEQYNETLREFEGRLLKAQSKVKRCNDLRELTLVEKNQAHETLDIAKLEKTRAEQKRDEQTMQVETFTQQAKACCPERAYIPSSESYQSIEKKFLAIKNQLEKRQRTVGATDEQIYNRAAEAKKAYEEGNRAFDMQIELQQALKRSLMDRLSRWRRFQRYISARSRANFVYLLSERGFRGKLLIDHENRKLALQVEPDETQKRAAGRNTKTLSGGEKSFSSICMLLSIWEAMGSPLRCLDEFDVFMDNVNRAISTNMLVGTLTDSTYTMVAY